MSKKSAAAVAVVVTGAVVAGGIVTGIIPTAVRWLKFGIRRSVSPYVPSGHTEQKQQSDQDTPPTP